LFLHTVFFAEYLAFDRVGSSRLARMATMAMTTNSSMSVKPAIVQRGTGACFNNHLVVLRFFMALYRVHCWRGGAFEERSNSYVTFKTDALLGIMARE